MARTLLALAPILLRACRAMSRELSWFLREHRGSRQLAKSRRDSPAGRNGRDWDHPAAGENLLHAGARHPLCFASKVDRSIPRLENKHGRSGVERDAIRAKP